MPIEFKSWRERAAGIEIQRNCQIQVLFVLYELLNGIDKSTWEIKTNKQMILFKQELMTIGIMLKLHTALTT